MRKLFKLGVSIIVALLVIAGATNVMALAPPPAVAVPLPEQTGTVIYPSGDVTTYNYSYANWWNQNWGAHQNAQVGYEPAANNGISNGWKTTLFKFNLGGVSADNINTAKFYFFHARTYGSNSGINLHEISESWVEGDGLYQGANSPSDPDDPVGVTANRLPTYGGVVANFTPPALATYFQPDPGGSGEMIGGQWVAVDITALVQGWLQDPGSNHGFILLPVQVSAYAVYSLYLREIEPTYQTNLSPYLEIRYAIGTDTDDDGVIDDDDNCPSTKNAGQEDDDNDGFGNACDSCPKNYTLGQTDTDADGVGDACDKCPEVADDQSDSDGDLVGDACDNCMFFDNFDQADADADGVGDRCDVCPNDPDNNIDGDTICGDQDNCPTVANDRQEDADGDGVGDACDSCPGDTGNDSDGDGVCDADDQCQGSDDNEDADGDGKADGCDSCPNDANDDADSDGVCGDIDNCPTTNNPTQADGDSDGFGDVCDACPNDDENDVDNDGICGDADNCPTDVNKTEPGECGCGEAETDSDSDGTPDCNDNCPTDPDKTEPGDSGCLTPEDFVLPGTNMSATPFSGLFINFGQVIGGGKVNFSQLNGAQPPAGYRFVSPAFDIGFSGIFSGPATLCFDYDQSKVAKAENMLKLMHRKAGQAWADITKSVDTDLNNICGETDTFSEFAVVEEAGSSSSSGCFIATAAYGSYWEPHVMTLRRFRDSQLLTNWVGTKFVKAYYRYSPPIADFIAEHDSLRQVVRIGLAPLVGFSWLAINFGAATALAVFFCLIASLAGVAGAIMLPRKDKNI